MSIGEVRLFDDMRDINATLRQRNEIEKQKLDVLKKIEKNLRMKSDR